ncbi:BZ3500_MvSof-1268-A1-R1_Chr5-1g07581 [Microbotryum saponariae]|uniref:BZ3500_MvSof-1268-A1-R1_Chr5-1g07581 protein n=1 Tax=Microbotryum saponariae TaxID=289078 RepID=A0A2X0NCZ2_9BASI|nr:BZ3500_MvSof-1268-A1-R1_Chr5-1g07581 [Microbotryum saponariae]SDA05452.1 BZ3501_MvSof-1269-A2-R1_Chr5-2g07405 [Microbotryum saponariae]
MLSNCEALDSPVFMIDASGTRTPAAGRGTLFAEFKLADGTTSKISISDVLHVPNFVVNLISGPTLCKQGVRIEMENEGRSQERSTIDLKAVEVSGSYRTLSLKKKAETRKPPSS